MSRKFRAEPGKGIVASTQVIASFDPNTEFGTKLGKVFKSFVKKLITDRFEDSDVLVERYHTDKLKEDTLDYYSPDGIMYELFGTYDTWEGQPELLGLRDLLWEMDESDRIGVKQWIKDRFYEIEKRSKDPDTLSWIKILRNKNRLN